MTKIYIASPYTKGDPAINVKIQMDCANRLMDLGFSPYVPLLCHFLHMANPRPYKDWMELDLDWIRVCDYLLRLPGESPGADREVEFAKSLNIPVVYSLAYFESL